MEMAENNNKEAEAKTAEARELLYRRDYELALLKFNEALNLADGDLIDSIKKTRAEALANEVESMYRRAWAAEYRTKELCTPLSVALFEQAKMMCQRADAINNNTDSQKTFDLITLKMEGDVLFKEAKAIKLETVELCDKADEKCKEAHCKYVSALMKDGRFLLDYFRSQSYWDLIIHTKSELLKAEKEKAQNNTVKESLTNV